jgi:hypothetical protein
MMDWANYYHRAMAKRQIKISVKRERVDATASYFKRKTN